MPLFVDDLFAKLSEPIKVYAEQEVIDILERDIFNWAIYPRFCELSNENGNVLEYKAFKSGDEFSAADLRVAVIGVNHKVPSVGFIVSDEKTTFAISGDTAEMNEFWERVNKEDKLDALLIECAFPNELKDLASASHHLTPDGLKAEIDKFKHKNCPIYVINIKPMYRDEIVAQIRKLNIENLQILEVGKVYDF